MGRICKTLEAVRSNRMRFCTKRHTACAKSGKVKTYVWWAKFRMYSTIVMSYDNTKSQEDVHYGVIFYGVKQTYDFIWISSDIHRPCLFTFLYQSCHAYSLFHIKVAMFIHYCIYHLWSDLWGCVAVQSGVVWVEVDVERWAVGEGKQTWPSWSEIGPLTPQLNLSITQSNIL